MKYLIICVFLIISSSGIAQQYIIEKNYHGIRENDSIVKVQVSFKDPGEAGMSVVWDYSNLNIVDEAYPLHYFRNADSILVGREHATRYHYDSEADSLYLLGYSNPTTYFDYLIPELLLTYPFFYQNSISDYFYGEGAYGGKIYFRMAGRNEVKADALGTLILPDQDTLRNVLRVHTSKKIVRNMSPNDSVLFRVNRDSTLLLTGNIQQELDKDSVWVDVDTYQWFARGYRYPIFESTQSHSYNKGELGNYFETAFYCPPAEQIYLKTDDPLNRERLEEEWWKQQDETNNRAKKQVGSKDPINSLLGEKEDFSYKVYMNNSNEELIIEFETETDKEIEVYLFNSQGSRLLTLTGDKEASSTCRRIADIKNYTPGEYLILFRIGDRSYTEKFIKK